MPKVSSKNQVTIPVDVLRAAGIEAGDSVVIRAERRGQIAVTRRADVLTPFAGAMPPGVFPPDWLDGLRDEWRA